MAGFCTYSRRWMDFIFTNVTDGCKRDGIHLQGGSCGYERCAYYEDRPVTRHYQAKLRILQGYDDEETNPKR